MNPEQEQALCLILNAIKSINCNCGGGTTGDIGSVESVSGAVTNTCNTPLAVKTCAGVDLSVVSPTLLAKLQEIVSNTDTIESTLDDTLLSVSSLNVILESILTQVGRGQNCSNAEFVSICNALLQVDLPQATTTLITNIANTNQDALTQLSNINAELDAQTIRLNDILAATLANNGESGTGTSCGNPTFTSICNALLAVELPSSTIAILNGIVAQEVAINAELDSQTTILTNILNQLTPDASAGLTQTTFAGTTATTFTAGTVKSISITKTSVTTDAITVTTDSGTFTIIEEGEVVSLSADGNYYDGTKVVKPALGVITIALAGSATVKYIGLNNT